MTPFHSLLPELAQREVRCVHLGATTETTPEPALPATNTFTWNSTARTLTAIADASFCR